MNESADFSPKDFLGLLQSIAVAELPQIPTAMQWVVDKYWRAAAVKRDVEYWDDTDQDRAVQVALVLAGTCKHYMLSELTDDSSALAWIRMLMPVAQYLFPPLRFFDKKFSRIGQGVDRFNPEIAVEQCLKNRAWLMEWVGVPGAVAEKVMSYLLKKDEWSKYAYDKWRNAGVQRLFEVVQGISEPAAVMLPESEPQLRVAVDHFVEVYRQQRWDSRLNEGQLKLFLLPSMRADYQPTQTGYALERLLLGAAPSGPRAIVVYGQGGAGKTVLAETLVHQPVVQQCFADGIFWFGAPPQRDVKEWLTDLCYYLGLSMVRSWGHNQRCWRDWLNREQRRVLLVLDDMQELRVWRLLLPNLGSESVVVVTTQDAEPVIATLAEWGYHIQTLAARGFAFDEAQAFVEARLGHSLTTAEAQGLEKLVALSGGHPGMIRWAATEEWAGNCWAEILQQWRAGRTVRPATEMLAQQWQRIPEKHAWFQALLRLLKPGYPFSDVLGEIAWNVPEHLAAHRLQELERTGLVETVKAQPDVLGWVPWWRIATMVDNNLRALAFPSRWQQWVNRVGRGWRALRARSSLCEDRFAVPWQFIAVGVVLVPLWVVLWVITRSILKLGSRLMGRDMLALLLLNSAAVPQADKYIRAFLVRQGRIVSAESWLLYEGLIIGSGNFAFVSLMVAAVLFCVLAARIGLAHIDLSRWEHIVWLISPVLALIFYGVYDQSVVWSVWLVHCLGVDEWDLRWLLRVARWLGMREPGAEDTQESC